MKKLLVVCGPTATGKTALGIKLAERFAGQIVSADSRQVYRNLDIATGKDIKGGSRKQLPWHEPGVNYYWEIRGVPIYLLDVINEDKSFSVAQYIKLAWNAVDEIHKMRKLPIVVGGTGLYIKGLIDGIGTLGIPPNPNLRAIYNKKTTEELYDILFHLVPDMALGLNFSERKNKQRLIRRIEIAQSNKKKLNVSPPDWDVLLVGLTAPYDILRKRIEKRIDQWVAGGAKEEVATLLDKGVSWESQAISSLGYRQWKPYFEKEAIAEEIVQKWKKDEWQYAKRQLTWFRKEKRIRWFDINNEGWQSGVEKLVSDWYN